MLRYRAGQLARWLVEGSNYQLERAHPCPEPTGVSMYFTLEPPGASVALMARLETIAVKFHYICVPDEEGKKGAWA